MLTERPDHVPADLVVDFDIYNIPDADLDIHLAYREFQQRCPDIFWTPRNGGHWVATRADDIRVIQTDYTHFSNGTVTIPPVPILQIPLGLDPPEHGGYRRPIVRALLPKIVSAMEAKVRSLAIGLVEELLPRGGCEFMEDFAKILPIVVFLDLVDLPREDRHFLAPIADRVVSGNVPERVAAAHSEIEDYLRSHIETRRACPGTDLLSTIVNCHIDGERIGLEQATAFAVLVLFGGLDTVASMMGFIARFLALNPGHRREIVENLHDEAFMQRAIEEMIRRHGVSHTGRRITQNFTYKGLEFHAGEMILPTGILFGLDDRKVADPLRVDFSRPLPIAHAAFGNGEHNCPGAVLARREVKIFLQEWLKLIPDFEIVPGTKPVMVTGLVNRLIKLELQWSL